MGNGKSNALIIITLIIGTSGLGMSAFTMIKYEVIQGPQGIPGEPGLDGLNGSSYTPIAFWQAVNGSGSFFYLDFYSIQLNKSEFFTLTEGNTAITLIKMGWYKFSIRFLLSDLSSTDDYSIHIIKNMRVAEMVGLLAHPQSSYWLISTSILVHSDGDDAFKFNCWSTGSDFFEIAITTGNQFIIEYVTET